MTGRSLPAARPHTEGLSGRLGCLVGRGEGGKETVVGISCLHLVSLKNTHVHTTELGTVHTKSICETKQSALDVFLNLYIHVHVHVSTCTTSVHVLYVHVHM